MQATTNGARGEPQLFSATSCYLAWVRELKIGFRVTASSADVITSSMVLQVMASLSFALGLWALSNYAHWFGAGR